MTWGGAWQIPSFDQFWELVRYCTFQWTTLNGIQGGRFTGRNGNSIFLPAAGIRAGSKHKEHGTYGHYWLGTRAYSSSTNLGIDLWYWDRRKHRPGKK